MYMCYIYIYIYIYHNCFSWSRSLVFLSTALVIGPLLVLTFALRFHVPVGSALCNNVNEVSK